jgi:hypothetical protein
MCFLALIFNVVQRHSGQNNAKGHTLTFEPKIRKVACNTLGVCHSLSSRFELKHDRLSGDDEVKANLQR